MCGYELHYRDGRLSVSKASGSNTERGHTKPFCTLDEVEDEMNEIAATPTHIR